MRFRAAGVRVPGLQTPKAWSATATYGEGDVVVRANALFVAAAYSLNADPLTDTTSTYWTFLALRGAVSNFIATTEQVTNTGAVAVATTPDTLDVWTPNGMVIVQFNAEWKLTGTSLAACSAQLQIDDTVIQTPFPTSAGLGAVASLPANGTFWGTLAPANSGVGVTSGFLAASAGTTQDSQGQNLPWNTNGIPHPFYVAAGKHTVKVKYAAGNATTVLNIRNRKLTAIGF